MTRLILTALLALSSCSSDASEGWGETEAVERAKAELRGSLYGSDTIWSRDPRDTIANDHGRAQDPETGELIAGSSAWGVKLRNVRSSRDAQARAQGVIIVERHPSGRISSRAMRIEKGRR